MTLTHRTHRSLQALVLAGLGLFLLHKIWSGTLYWYISQRFVWLVVLAAAVLLALAALVLPRPRATAGHAPDHEHDHAHDHRHNGVGAAPLWGLLLVAVPLALGLLIPVRPLDTAAIANKGINTTAPLTAGGSAPKSAVATGSHGARKLAAVLDRRLFGFIAVGVPPCTA